MGLKPTRPQRSEGIIDFESKEAFPLIPCLMKLSASHGRGIVRSASQFIYYGNIYLQQYFVYNIIYIIIL